MRVGVVQFYDLRLEDFRKTEKLRITFHPNGLVNSAQSV
jgi:hypothetical protein